MAAPTHTTIGTPAGIRLKDGHRTVMVFNRLPAFSIWETEVTPPMVSVGDSIDLTTMREVGYVIREFQTLLDSGEFDYTGAWDPGMYDQARTSLVGKNGSCTLWLPDLSYIDFYGGIRELKPQAMSRGKMPLVTATVTVTNYDPAGHVEAGWVLSSVAGT
jgi:hypothetical protein